MCRTFILPQIKFLIYTKSVIHILSAMAGRKKLNRALFGARVAEETPEKIKEIAIQLGYLYNGEGSPGQLLDAIASGDIILIQRAHASKYS
jgi:hypothetical protein